MRSGLHRLLVALISICLLVTLGVHRGLVLSYSPTRKNRICQDLFYAQLYIIPELTNPASDTSITSWISDGQATVGEPHHPLTVKEFETEDEDQPSADIQMKGIFFNCVGRNFNGRQPQGTNEYFISNAFRRGWWLSYASNLERRIPMGQGFHVSLSPEYVHMEQKELEQQYFNVRKTMEVLQKESPEYTEFIGERDAFSSLSVFKKLFLCASILSSPIYRVDRLEFSLEWMEENRFEMSLGFETKRLRLTNTDSEMLTFQGFICEGFVDGDRRNSDSTELFITQAYDNKHSVYVVKHKDEHFVLDKYFQKVPLLMNVGEPLDEGSIYVNYT